VSDATERNEAEAKAAEATEPTEETGAGAGAEAAQAESKAAEGKPTRRFKKSAPKPADVARSYFKAFETADLDSAAKFWAPDILERIAPVGDLKGPGEVRAFFQQLFGAFPDMRLEVLDLVATGNQVAVRWRSTGTFCGGPFQGIDPTGTRLDMEGIDLLTIEDGLIRRNDAYYDGTQFARQVGLLPPRDSTAERGMAAAFNARTRLWRRFFAPSKEQVAEGVWLLRGGFPMKTMNVYLIEDEGGVTVFDAGIKAMASGIASAGAQMGGIKRVVLGHGHADHRGAASRLSAPVFCHPDEVADAEGDGGEHYFDFSKLRRRYARLLMPRLLRTWDGGPVKIEGTVSEGDDVAGFKVVHLPGHAPGLIGLWRESDRLALVSDTTYTLDPETGRHGPPRVPHRAFNKDTELARASIRKLAAMEPEVAWPGHADPIKGDVRGQLERAAAET
jgi:hydroxyacylglutathione hydrolase